MITSTFTRKVIKKERSSVSVKRKRHRINTDTLKQSLVHKNVACNVREVIFRH